MIKFPKFKSHYHAEVIEDNVVLLLSEISYFQLTGRSYALVAPFLTGEHSTDDIANKLDDKLSALDVFYVIALLEKKGYIFEADPKIPNNFTSFCHIQNLDVQKSWAQLKKTSVAVASFGNVAIEEITQQLKTFGVNIVSENSDITIVVVEDYLISQLEEFNKQQIKDKRPWILVKPVGVMLWIGPIFSFEKTACWECLAHRLRGNREVESFVLNAKKQTTPLVTSSAFTSSTYNIAINMMITEAIKWIIKKDVAENKTSNQMVTFDTLHQEFIKHTLTKRSQCPACGTPLESDRKPKEIELKSQKKKFLSGGYRCTAPEQTIAKYIHHVSPITGIITSLIKSDYSHLESQQIVEQLMHVYFAGHNLALKHDKLYFLRNSLRSNSAGKGTTELQAKAGALCEALERYSGVFQGDEIRISASYEELEDPIWPNDYMHYSEKQFEQREQINAKGSRFQVVPLPLDKKAKIEWSPYWSLTHKKFKYIPTSYSYFSYPINNQEHFFCSGDSNGNAAGNNTEEAISQGFFELVERDAVSVWWYNRLKRPGVDLKAMNDPYICDLLECYKQLNRDLWVLDITNDLQIPAFAAISRRTDKKVEDIVIGTGAHSDPRIAIYRAITEANQFLPAVLTINSDGSGRYAFFDKDSINWWQTATIENQPHLVPASDAKTKLSNFATTWKDDIAEDVKACQALVENLGLEMLVLDQTRSDIGVSVVKVIVPGLRHFWARFAPGRLYDVPVKMGWLKEPTKEEHLNPIPIFF